MTIEPLWKIIEISPLISFAVKFIPSEFFLEAREYEMIKDMRQYGPWFSLIQWCFTSTSLSINKQQKEKIKFVSEKKKLL